MFKNVLVGVDGSPNGRDAIALATQLRCHEGRLTLAHVHRGELAVELEGSHELLERERADTGVEAQLISMVSASPGRGLHEQAEEQGADLLVVGSCRHSTFGRAMLGDDTRAALNGAPCAVAVATRGYAERPTPITKVGVAYNGSAESTAALELARELAATTAATVHALEVVSLPPAAYGGMVPPVGEYIDGMLKEANGRLQELSGVDAHAVYGIPGEELAAFGDAVDILVVGSRGYGPVRRLVVSSTSNYLERHARCSLLVLPRTVGTADAPGDSKPRAEMPAAAI
jgi:nucleotide-binding universal stress UspA family protein